MKVYFETYGCTMNQGDSEIMMGSIEKEHELVNAVKDCDVAVINSCGVIGYTERKVLRRIAELKHMNKKVIVSGCLPVINYDAVERYEPQGIISLHSLNSIGKAIDNIGSDGRFRNVLDVKYEKTCVYKNRLSKIIAIVPIAEGCLGECTYCGTRIARGKLKSYPLDSIVSEVEDCISRGYKEIQLTAQDTGIYGLDIGTRLPDLLTSISNLEGKFRVRVGMMNPRFAIKILDDLVEAFKHEKIYKFLHLPVQTGDNKVLKDMQRGYSVEDFTEIISAFRREFEITISTDVIVGYPTEDEDSFSKTYELIERIEPDVLNITRFSPRPKTKAAGLKDMPERYKKERSRKLTKLGMKIGLKNNKKFLGRKLEVLVNGPGKDASLLGRDESYKQVILKEGVLGEFKKVKIRDFRSSYLISE